MRAELEPALPEDLRRLVRDHGAILRLVGLAAENLRELADAMGIDTVSPRAAERCDFIPVGLRLGEAGTD